MSRFAGEAEFALLHSGGKGRISRMPVNPYEKYKQQSVMTMTQGEMLVKLYEETVKQLSGATMYIESKDFEKANKSLQKSQRILNHLKSTLNYEYDVSNNLSALYDFFLARIVEANIKKDASPIREVIPMVDELRETFGKADRLSRLQHVS